VPLALRASDPSRLPDTAPAAIPPTAVFKKSRREAPLHSGQELNSDGMDWDMGWLLWESEHTPPAGHMKQNCGEQIVNGVVSRRTF